MSNADRGSQSRSTIGIAGAFFVFGANFGALTVLTLGLLSALAPIGFAAGAGVLLHYNRNRQVSDWTGTIAMIGWSSFGCLIGAVGMWLLASRVIN